MRAEGKRRKVTGTANFARNLEGLRAFHTASAEVFERAIAKLQDEILPLLRQQPNVGRLHAQASPLVERIRLRLGGGVLREVLIEEYVMLYLVGEKQLVLLSMRHQIDFGD